jgi:transcriptional regulator with XRE-family HTH domain
MRHYCFREDPTTTTAALAEYLQSLERRRKELKMAQQTLAKRSGLSRATVCRLLSGDHVHADFLHIVALSEALGVKLIFVPTPLDEFVEQRAEQVSNRLVSLVQGTMGLESQAVGPETITRMKQDACRRLLTGSRRKL